VSENACVWICVEKDYHDASVCHGLHLPEMLATAAVNVIVLDDDPE